MQIREEESADQFADQMNFKLPRSIREEQLANHLADLKKMQKTDQFEK